jgi:hypothetical protein
MHSSLLASLNDGYSTVSYPKLTPENLHKLYLLAHNIGKDYVELSHDKVRWQRDDYIQWARDTLGELDWDDEFYYPGSDVQDQF